MGESSYLSDKFCVGFVSSVEFVVKVKKLSDASLILLWLETLPGENKSLRETVRKAFASRRHVILGSSAGS